MKYYTQLNLPIYENLLASLTELLSNNIISWDTDNQICINTTENDPDNYLLGTGSLYLDWKKHYKISDNDIIQKTIVKNKNFKLKETDFSIVCNQFKNTVYENIFDMLKRNFNLGRLRIMKSQPNTCLSWHRDPTPRIHYPIQTNDKCKMAVEDTVFHLAQNKWWLVDTTYYHTAFNGSRESRIHLVGEILNKI